MLHISTQMNWPEVCHIPTQAQHLQCPNLERCQYRSIHASSPDPSLVTILKIWPLIGCCHLSGLDTSGVTRVECGETCYSSSTANLVTASHWSDVNCTGPWLAETLSQTKCIQHMQFTGTKDLLISHFFFWQTEVLPRMKDNLSLVSQDILLSIFFLLAHLK